MKVAAAALLLALATPAIDAWAQPATVDDATLRAAIDRELQGVPRDGQLDVRLEGGVATVTYIRPDGLALARSVTLPPRADDAVELVALLAGNLVRDQAGDVLADLSLPAPPPYEPRRVPVSVGIFPPISTDLAYGEPVIPYVALNVAVGVSPGLRGVAMAGAIDIQRDLAVGAQLAGATVLAMKDMKGFQAAGAASITLGHISGMQTAGVLAMADSFSGLQWAPVNIARRARGLQLGIFNYADELDGVSIGAVSIVRKGGITEVDAWGESNGTAHLMLRHGARWFHNVYGVATKAPGDSSVQMYGLGFGGRMVSGPIDGDVTVMTWTGGGPGLDSDLTLLNQARVTLGVGLGRRFALLAGASLNVFVGDNLEKADALNPVLDTTFTDGETSVRMWPSFFAGLRVR
jgi:hypothetical protein